MVGLFCKKQLTAKVDNYFCRKAPPYTFDWALNTALDNTFKKSIRLKDISPVL